MYRNERDTHPLTEKQNGTTTTTHVEQQFDDPHLTRMCSTFFIVD
jgi:hypothetical protein